MASYTIQLRKVIEYYGIEEVKSWFKDYKESEYLTSAQAKIITENNLYNKEYLVDMIINHYYMQEIGFETPYLFAFNVKNKMKEIMGKYLPIFYSMSLNYDPLVNEKYEEIFSRNINSQGTIENGLNTQINTNVNNTQESSNTLNQDNTQKSTDENNSTINTTDNHNITDTNNNLMVNSDTPQGQINKSNILDGTYASSTQASEASNTRTDINTQNSTTKNNETTSITQTQQSTNNMNASETQTQSTINTSNQTTTSQDTTKEGYSRKVEGNRGIYVTQQKLILEYRNTIINIYNNIIEDLQDLFMLIY